ncbi:MAG: hypothetical protein M5U19_00200 [Microthrixaceae bacterium]|nr:hypothetical protein [Microthrixaceae bacterium]
MGASTAAASSPAATETSWDWPADDVALDSSNFTATLLAASAGGQLLQADAALAGPSHSYDYHPDFARAPPADPSDYTDDTITNSTDPAGSLGRVLRAFLGLEVERSAPRAASAADDAVATGRTASTSWGRTIDDFQQHGDHWRRVSAHAEGATGRAYRAARASKRCSSGGGDRLVRHRIYGPSGDILHETFRPYAKFGEP